MMETGKRALHVMLTGLLLLLVQTPVVAGMYDEQIMDEPVFGGTMLVREAGRNNAVMLLLVHGLGHDAGDIWQDTVAELAQDYHVVVPDLPGFGRSGRANKLYSPENYSRLLRWLIDQLPGKPVIMAGHSLGGAIALYFSAVNGGMIERLILVDAVGLLHRQAVSQNFLRDVIALDLPIPTNTQETILGRVAGLVLERAERIPLDMDLVLSTSITREKFLAADPMRIAALALVQTDYSLLLTRVTTPTWLIWGEKDTIAPVRIATILGWHLPQVQTYLMPEAGHVPMRESSHHFNRIFSKALRENPGVRIPSTDSVAIVQDGVCNNQSSMVFRGHYRRLDIANCSDVRMEAVHAEHIEIRDSQVVIESSTVGDMEADHAVTVIRSHVTMTAVDVYGRIGVVTEQSRFDLAGMRFYTTDKVFTARGNPSALLLSSSVRHNNGTLTPLHFSRPLRHGESF